MSTLRYPALRFWGDELPDPRVVFRITLLRTSCVKELFVCGPAQSHAYYIPPEIPLWKLDETHMVVYRSTSAGPPLRYSSGLLRVRNSCKRMWQLWQLTIRQMDVCPGQAGTYQLSGFLVALRAVTATQ